MCVRACVCMCLDEGEGASIQDAVTYLTTQATFAWEVSIFSGIVRAKSGILDDIHLSFSDILQHGELPGDKPSLAIVMFAIHS